MGEGAAAIAVTERKDVRHAGAEFVVNDDVAPRVNLNSGLIKAQIIRIRPAADREQDVGGQHLGLASRAFDPDTDFGASRLESDAFRIKADRDSFGFEYLLNRRRNILVFVRN